MIVKEIGISNDKIKDSLKSHRSKSLWENTCIDFFKFAPKLK
jgi:hypothetical protein